MRITLSQKHRMQWPLFTQQCILLNVEYFLSLFGIHVSFICSVYCILMMTHCILICRIDFIALKVCSVYGCGAWLRKAKNYMNVILFSLRSSDGWVPHIRSGVQIDGNVPSIRFLSRLALANFFRPFGANVLFALREITRAPHFLQIRNIIT